MILNPCSKETVLFLKLPGYFVLYSVLLLLYACLLGQRQPELLGTRLKAVLWYEEVTLD